MSYKKGKRRVYVCRKCGKELQATEKPTKCLVCFGKNTFEMM